MQTFEAKQLTNGQSVTYDVGSGFEYVRIINESGYQLTASLGSLGTETIPVWHLMDINCINRNTGRPLLTGSIGIMP